MPAIPHTHRPGPRLHTHAHVPAPARTATTVLLAACACAALLALAACGVSSGATPGGSQSASRGQPFIPGATVRPCTGPYASAAGTSPAVVLTLQSPGQAGSAQLGQVVQVQLPITHQWSLIAVPNGLQLVGPAAQQDAQKSVCFWNFKAGTAGKYVIGFIGVTQCDAKMTICQQSTETQRFTLSAQ